MLHFAIWQRWNKKCKHNCYETRKFEDFAFKKKQMQSGRWASQETISLLNLRHNFPVKFSFFCLITFQYNNALSAISSIAIPETMMMGKTISLDTNIKNIIRLLDREVTYFKMWASYSLSATNVDLKGAGHTSTLLRWSV